MDDKRSKIYDRPEGKGEASEYGLRAVYHRNTEILGSARKGTEKAGEQVFIRIYKTCERTCFRAGGRCDLIPVLPGIYRRNEISR